MGRTPCCDRAAVKRGPWSPEEDDALRDYMLRYGNTGSWITLPKRAGLRRCGKSCRLRWLNYLRPDIRHGGFTDEEDALIYSLYSQLGSKWSTIASQLERRTDNDVKNHWNTKLKKRLAAAASAFPAAASAASPSLPPLPAPAAARPSPSPSSSLLLPLAAPTVKAEAYAYDYEGDFLAPPAAAFRDTFVAAAEGSTSASLSAASSGSNWSAVDNGAAADAGFFADFCTAAGSDLAAADQLFLTDLYYPLDPTLSLV